MKLFILYSDLADNRAGWIQALKGLVSDHHKVCVITPHMAKTEGLLRKNHLAEVKCLATHENISIADQVEQARQLTQVQECNVIIALSDISKLNELEKTMPEVDIIEIDVDNKKPTIFTGLQKFSVKNRSKLAEFNDLNNLLDKINYGSMSSWSITPSKNRLAQKDFLNSLMEHVDQCPNKSKAQCILEIKAEYEMKGKLDDVIFAPANVYFFKWQVFSESTPVARIIEASEKNVSAEVVANIIAAVEKPGQKVVYKSADAEEYEEHVAQESQAKMRAEKSTTEAMKGTSEERLQLRSTSYGSYGTFN